MTYRRHLIPSLACWVVCRADPPPPPGRSRFAGHPAFHTGMQTETLTHTVVFRQQFSMPGAPLATNRYRR